MRIIRGGGIDSHTKLLLHFNGVDGATVTHDATGRHTITMNDAGATNQIDNGMSRFHDTSWYIDEGASRGITISDNLSDFEIGTGQFTIDFWMKNVSDSGYPFTIFYTSDANWRIYYNGVNIWYWQGDISGWCATDANLHHYALVREGTGTEETKCYRDGVLTNSLTKNHDFSSITSALIASQYNAVNPTFIDEFRFSDIARWTGNFTPPTRQYGGG